MTPNPSHLRLSLWILLAASALGTCATLASSRGLEWLASAGLLCGAVVLFTAARCPRCGRSRLGEVLRGRITEPCGCRTASPGGRRGA